MTDLEVFRLSAEACGKIVATGATGGSGILIHGPFVPVLIDWNPFTNAEQRWQCVEKLLKTHVIEMEQLDPRDGAAHCVLNKNDRKSEGGFCLDCPASEFPARALAELQRRNKKE